MKIKKIAFVILAVLLIMQIIQIDTKVIQTNTNSDFLISTKAPNEISGIIRASCYDCHSNETNYPWYSKVAPVSWMLKNHIQEGREHLNFSNWANYSLEKRNSLQEEIKEEIEKNKMPLKSYTIIHSNAKIVTGSKSRILEWLSFTE